MKNQKILIYFYVFFLFLFVKETYCQTDCNYKTIYINGTQTSTASYGWDDLGGTDPNRNNWEWTVIFNSSSKSISLTLDVQSKNRPYSSSPITISKTKTTYLLAQYEPQISPCDTPKPCLWGGYCNGFESTAQHWSD